MHPSFNSPPLPGDALAPATVRGRRLPVGNLPPARHLAGHRPLSQTERRTDVRVPSSQI